MIRLAAGICFRNAIALLKDMEKRASYSTSMSENLPALMCLSATECSWSCFIRLTCEPSRIRDNF